jgi:putative Ca2+/H+ antiporter (TMEM165/GDT1 family)
MDWQIFWITFWTIFIAELGDKTQLGVLSLSAASRSPLTVFAAASAALILATLAGVLSGAFLSRFINPRALKIGGGLIFVLVGLWMIMRGD